MSLLNKMDSETAIGIFSKTTDSAIIEATGLSGLDFVILDCEHGYISFETLYNHVRASQLSGISSIVRVSNHEANNIATALDSGAEGVQIPNINSAKQAKDAVSAARFFPNGNRGVCRFVKAANYGTKERQDYFKDANKSIIILQVEGLEGVRNIDEILDVPNFDVLFIGPYDLSQSVGKPGDVTCPEVISLMREIATKAKQKNIKLGTFCDTLDTATLFKEEGFHYIAYSVDINIYINALVQLNRQIK